MLSKCDVIQSKDVKLLKNTDACTVYCLETERSYKLNTVDTELILYYPVYCFSTSVITFWVHYRCFSDCLYGS